MAHVPSGLEAEEAEKGAHTFLPGGSGGGGGGDGGDGGSGGGGGFRLGGGGDGDGGAHTGVPVNTQPRYVSTMLTS